MPVRLALLGVRGSTPAAGREFVRYGGHTACVAISREDEAPRLILDAGTGIRGLAGLMEGGPFRGTILLSHLHWDHTQGLPFCTAADRPDAGVDVRMPAQDGEARAVFARVMSPPHFPIGPDQLRGRWSFSGLEPGVHRIEGFDVLAREIPHKGGRTFGFRITDGNVSVAYLSDHDPLALGLGPARLGEYHAAALDLVRGVDVLIHDSRYTAAELPERRDFGHSTVEYAVGLALEAGVRRLLLFHHDPTRTDDAIDAILAGLCAGSGELRVEAATQGSVIELS